MGTATRNRRTVFSRGMDRGKDGCAEYCGNTPQLDLTNGLKNSMRVVNFLRNVMIY